VQAEHEKMRARSFNTLEVTPLHASHQQGSSMAHANAIRAGNELICHYATATQSQMNEFHVELEVDMELHKWSRKLSKIEYSLRLGVYWVSFDGGSEGLIMPSFKSMLACAVYQ